MYQARTLHSRPMPRPAKLIAAVFRAIWLSRQRHALRELDDHILDDIGLTRSQAEQEASRPFWDAPRHWQQ